MKSITIRDMIEWAYERDDCPTINGRKFVNEEIVERMMWKLVAKGSFVVAGMKHGSVLFGKPDWKESK